MEINKLKLKPNDSLVPPPVAVVETAPKVKKEKPRRVKKLHSEDKIADPNKVFVAGLSFDSTTEQLKEYFASVGGISKAEVLSTRKGRSLGSGIIEFVNEPSVAASIANFNQKEWMGRVITVREYYQ
jgi:RNA recognition motif-containing protein